MTALRLGLALSLFAVSGCSAIWGIDELRYDRAGTGAAATTSSSDTTTSTPTGTGGQGATAGTGGTVGTGGSGGVAGTGSGSVIECGDGVIAGEEQCDDGNNLPNDGCFDCTVECDGAYEVEETVTHHCYYLIADDDVQTAMAAACAAWGGHLATITSAAEDVLVDAYLTENAWIGANDRANEGVFVWENGEPWSFTDWGPTQPDNWEAGEDCVEVRRSEGDWNDSSCTLLNAGLCEREPPGANR